MWGTGYFPIVIPEAATRLSGIHTPGSGYGIRARAAHAPNDEASHCAPKRAVRFLSVICAGRTACRLMPYGALPMFRPARALLIAAALAVSATPAVAKDRPGALDQLSGVFAESPELCRSYRRATTHFAIVISKVKGKHYYDYCNAKACVDRILSYTRSAGGLVLRVREDIAPDEPARKVTVKHISDNQFIFTEQGRPPSTRIRCTEADFVAGIGLPDPDDRDNNDPDYSVSYSLRYALLVPTVCPELAVDRDVISKRLGPPKPVLDWFVKTVPEHDKTTVKDYCQAVLGSFGPNGRVIPNLLRPASAKN